MPPILINAYTIFSVDKKMADGADESASKDIKLHLYFNE